MKCPECERSPLAMFIVPAWTCPTCQSENCSHVTVCICLTQRDPKDIPPDSGEPRIHPGILKQELFTYSTFTASAVAIGLNLQLAEMMGADREAASKQLFEVIEKNMAFNAQNVLRGAYKGTQVNETDVVAARRIVKEFVDQIRKIAMQVGKPPPDIGTHA